MDNTVSLQAANRVLVAEDNAVNQLVMKGLLGLLDLEHDIVRARRRFGTREVRVGAGRYL